MTQQPWETPQQPPRGRGPLVLVIVLILVLIALVATGLVLVLRRVDDDKPAPKPPAAKQAVEFRRVLKSTPGTCSTPAPKVVCGADGTSYSLGPVELDGSHVTEAKAGQRDTSWYVGLKLDAQGTKMFTKLTTELAAKQPPDNLVAIVVGPQVVTAPSISSAITTSEVEISGSYTKQQAEDLAAKING
jgi:preprotein translocase subunit SecD